MPLLPWAGSGALGGRADGPLVVVGTLAWLVIGAHVVEDSVGAAGTVALLAAFALIASARRSSGDPGERHPLKQRRELGARTGPVASPASRHAALTAAWSALALEDPAQRPQPGPELARGRQPGVRALLAHVEAR